MSFFFFFEYKSLVVHIYLKYSYLCRYLLSLFVAADQGVAFLDSVTEA